MGMATSLAVSIEKVSKIFVTSRGTVTAVDDVSFDIAEGEFVCIVGPSGCGKTTLLKGVAGLVSMSKGQISVFGEPVLRPYKQVGMVFQQPVLLKWRTILRNVTFPSEILKERSGDLERRARDLLGLVGLADYVKSYPYELSGGMQQRAAIARALMHNPKLLLMDEPFGALDQMTRESMNVELMRIWAETQKTTLLITHSIEEAVFLADRVVVMTQRPGRVAAIISIPLERPRRSDVRFTEAFTALKEVVENAIREPTL